MKNQKISLDTNQLLGFRLAKSSDFRVTSQLETKVPKVINPPSSKVGKITDMPSAMVGKRAGKTRENIPPAMVGKVGKAPTN